MSQAITHFAVGATIAILAVTFLVPNVRYPRTWTIVAGGWAMVPDASKLLETSGTLGFHDSVWADLFWAHRALDRADPTDSTVWASVAVAAFLGATLIAEHRSYRTLEVVRAEFEEGSVLDRE
ncbi:hypothetical protein GCM10028857_05720 [Salinarchaeum chitinilyticum]